MSDTITPQPGATFTGTRDAKEVRGSITRVFGPKDLFVMFLEDTPEVPEQKDDEGKVTRKAKPAYVKRTPERINPDDFTRFDVHSEQ